MSQVGRPVLDHVVINVGTALDEAEQRYRALGFQLTARGHHTLGSSNHLAMFGENYLELLGVEPDKTDRRPDLVAARRGLNALVFKTTDADQLRASLLTRGAPHAEVRSFSRPVPEGGEARFRTVGLPDVPGIAGRAFFCEHQTPEHVWLPGLSDHPNGVQDIVGYVLAAAQPDDALGHYARWFDGVSLDTDAQGHRGFQAGRARVVCCTGAQLATAYGIDVPDLHQQVAVMAALHLRVASMATLLDVLAASGVAHQRHGAHCVVAPADAAGVGLVFSA